MENREREMELVILKEEKWKVLEVKIISDRLMLVSQWLCLALA